MDVKLPVKVENKRPFLLFKADLATLERIHGLQEHTLGSVKNSNIQQLGLGFSCGWFVGFLATKVGKILCLTIGGAVILLDVAADRRYVDVNWEKVKNDMQEMCYEMVTNEENRSKRYDKVKGLFEQYRSLASGLLGGFLIGLGTF